MLKPISIIYSALLFMFLSACSNDIDDGESPVSGQKNVTISLEATAMENGRGTRAEVNFEDTKPLFGEKIYNAYVVMAKKENGKEKVKNIFNVRYNSVDDEEKGGYIRKRVTNIDTDGGEYVFYNFANLPFTTTFDTNNVITGLKVLDKDIINALVSFTTIDNPATDNDETEIIDDNRSTNYSCWFNGLKLHTTDPSLPYDFDNFPVGLPMSNREEYTLDRNTSITLHLYRMMAKTRIYFKNMTGKDVRIHHISMSNVTANHTTENNQQIKLLPPKNENNTIITDLAENSAKEVLTIYDDPCEIIGIDAEGKNIYQAKTEKGIEVEANATQSMPDYYINESRNTTVNKSFQLTIEFSEMDGDKRVVRKRQGLISVEEVPRNAILLIPVNLTEYEMGLEAFFYPPIGGYPPFTLEKDNIKEDFTATFSTGGDFVLSPTFYLLQDKDNPEKYIDLTDPNKIETYNINILNAPEGFFTPDGAPAKNPVTGEILGTLTGQAGTATIEVEIVLKNESAGTYTLNHYRRRIYIHVPETKP